MPTLSRLRATRPQRGFTLIELMVAMAIGLVVALGFAVSFVNLKSTWGTQDKLAQLQDNERLAMAFLTTSIEEAGYFPDSTPPGLSKQTAINLTTDLTYGGTAAGQFLVGTPVTALGGTVSLSTVYTTASGDGVLTCQGATNGSGGNVTVRNVFYVNTTTHTLNCIVTTFPNTAALNGSDQPLITNVDSMALLYAVDTDSPADGSADTYMTAAQVQTSGNWNNVKAVRVTVNFINPNAALDPTHATIPWVQTINLMNNR